MRAWPIWKCSKSKNIEYRISNRKTNDLGDSNIPRFHFSWAQKNADRGLSSLFLSCNLRILFCPLALDPFCANGRFLGAAGQEEILHRSFFTTEKGHFFCCQQTNFNSRKLSIGGGY